MFLQSSKLHSVKTIYSLDVQQDNAHNLRFVLLTSIGMRNISLLFFFQSFKFSEKNGSMINELKKKK